LLADLYRAVFGDKPEPLMESIKTWPSSCGLNGWNALPRIQELLKASRVAGIPIPHVTLLTDSGIPAWLEASSRATQKSVVPPIPRLSTASGAATIFLTRWRLFPANSYSGKLRPAAFGEQPWRPN